MVENTVAPFRSAARSPSIGPGWRSRLIATFVWRMTTHRRISPDLRWTAATGAIQGVGLLTCSMMSRSSRRCSSAVTLCRTWNGTRLCGNATGCTESSVWILVLKLISFPTPWSNCGYSLMRRSDCFDVLPTWVEVIFTAAVMCQSPSSLAVSYDNQLLDVESATIGCVATTTVMKWPQVVRSVWLP